jgi:hypothetical protein
MTLLDIFNAVKSGGLPLDKAVFLGVNPTLPKSSTLSETQILERLGGAEVRLFASIAEGANSPDFTGVFIGSTAYLAEGMQPCVSLEEFIVNVSGW